MSSCPYKYKFYICSHKHRWFSGRMLACHAGGPGSIPGRCIFIFPLIMDVLFYCLIQCSVYIYILYMSSVFYIYKSIARPYLRLKCKGDFSVKIQHIFILTMLTTALVMVMSNTKIPIICLIVRTNFH